MKREAAETNQTFTTKSRPSHLPSWNEQVGIFKGISSDEEFTYIDVGDVSLAFRNGSDEAAYVKGKLKDSIVGKRIGILRTDLAGKPLLIRLLDREDKAGQVERLGGGLRHL